MIGFKYQAYPEYKDSGVEWLGDIPAHWKSSKIKYLASFQVGWTPATGKDENFIGKNLWANISDLKNRYLYETAKKISDRAAEEASMKITPKGSLLYSFKLSVGVVSFAGRDLYTNEAIASFLEHSHIPLSLLYYVLPEFVIKNASTNIYGARILNQGLINNALILVPSFDESFSIANFLDHQTAKIDTLIEKQKNLIKLLKEKRQAVISHAVTKGLNPDAPMKDSGVEWLGKVPEHWEIKSIKVILNERKEKNDPIKTSEILSLTIDRGVIPYSERGAGGNKSKNDLTAYMLAYPGDIVLNSMNVIFGSVGLSKYFGAVSPVYYMLRPRKHKDNVEYFSQIFLSETFQRSLLGLGNGILMIRMRIPMEKLNKQTLPYPPCQEQKCIANFLDHQTAKIDVLIAKATQAISLMQERRTALISAAVTGKIDLRNWQAPI